ncbi:MAG: DUF928 domain-containing protein [Leptolyngbyaceae cyanobacterium RM1_1_2]|nr:DUF928 domain-containing protein [Leptolyngbyaceae cyanobacterium RM1_1_2]
MAGLKHLPQKLWLRLLAALLVIATLGLATPKASAVDAIGRIRQIFGDGNQQGGATGRSRGGAIRDEYCIFSNAERDPVGRTAENLVALLPATNLGKTTEAYPTLWFYIPVGQDSDADHIQLDLLDGDTLDPVFAAPIRFEIPSAPGIVGVTLPENTPPLQTGKSYLWFLSVECSEADASRNPIVFAKSNG